MSLKDQLQKTQEEIEEAGKINDEQKTQLHKRGEEARRLSNGVAGIKEEKEMMQTHQRRNNKFIKSTEVLDEILIHYRSPSDKFGISYVNFLTLDKIDLQFESF